MVDRKMKTVTGSYSPKDVIFLLKDLSEASLERSLDVREQAIQSGTHYSEMLPVEYEPTEAYLKLFHESLHTYKRKVATAIGTVSELIVERKGTGIVLVSLARGGTPVGILIKRYVKEEYELDVPHYSVSIIRGRGIDENAMMYIARKHPDKRVVFVDGWTGKGAISKELTKSVHSIKEKHGITLDDELAVLADPGYCSSLFGTREDFLIPSACLNSTVSGLVSRTVLNDLWIDETDFHGAKVYSELCEKDVSNHFIGVIENEFKAAAPFIQEAKQSLQQIDTTPTWIGLKTVSLIQEHFGIENINFVKPGVGETTRVLLRRLPWKILVKDLNNPDLGHIFQLANERGVPVEEYEQMTYTCCGLIKPLENDI
ncbi:cysteine protease StiP family protein [Filibacter tadaridae]|uniref:Cysteine protease StiP n=1 Tax=Filibacter tadaridae TaxID=2483811 RepID=A0A3P5WP12_9BACL|nr:cysteine protease StiP family protein [Filibacter tadaridae]VDC20990.1 Cysteine protease StiP precursor [Filibacter tadaridae]